MYYRSSAAPTGSKAHGQGVVKKMSRREIANSNERRRMQQINTGFDALKECVPGIPDKQSKASILLRSAQYIKILQQQLAMAQQTGPKECHPTMTMHVETQTPPSPSRAAPPVQQVTEPQLNLQKRAEELEKLYEMERQRNSQLAESISVLSQKIKDLQDQCARYLPSPMSLPQTPPRGSPPTMPMPSPHIPPTCHPTISPALTPWEPPMSAPTPLSMQPLPPQADTHSWQPNVSARPDPSISHSMWYPPQQQPAGTGSDPATDALPPHARMSISSFVSSYSETKTPSSPRQAPAHANGSGQPYTLIGTQQVAGVEGGHGWGWGGYDKVSEGLGVSRRASGANNLDTLVEAMQHVEQASRLAGQGQERSWA